MVHHPFIEFLRTLSKDEVQKFRDFISSPYFNKKERLIKFFDAAIKYYPLFAGESLNKENFYQKLYPLKFFHDSTIRDTLSDLLGLSKEFLLIEKIKYHKAEVADVLLSEYVERNMRRHFLKSMRELEDELLECKIDSEFFLLKHKLEANKYNFNAINSKFTKINHVIEQFDEIKKSELYFLLYFILEFISDYVKVFSFSMSYNIGQKVNLYDEVIENIDLEKIYHLMKGKIEYDFIIELYLKMLQAFKNYTNDTYFKNYKTTLEKYSKNLSNNELTFHYSNLINFCVLKRFEIK